MLPTITETLLAITTSLLSTRPPSSGRLHDDTRSARVHSRSKRAAGQIWAAVRVCAIRRNSGGIFSARMCGARRAAYRHLPRNASTIAPEKAAEWRSEERRVGKEGRL